MRKNILILLLILLVSSCATAAPLPSRTRQHVTVITSSRPRRHPVKPSRVVVKRVVVGTRVKVLPVNRVVIYFNNLPFIYADGIYYREVAPTEYEVVKPEKGMIIPQLPANNVETVWLHGVAYYLFDDVLYREIPTQTGIQFEVAGFINL